MIRKSLFLALIVSSIFVCAFAQDPAVVAARNEVEQWRKSRADALTRDFGQLERYRAANAALLKQPADERRVVFMGDSITDFWQLEKYFPGKPYVNRGISAQTTSQMLIRFHQDVIALQPAAVVILAGTNDIAENTGPISNEDIEANLASMADIAKANGVQVVFSSVLPVHNYTEGGKRFFPLRTSAKINALNGWMRNYCLAKGCVYLNYYDSMLDERGLLRRSLAEDGLHPNDEGYKLMVPLVEEAVQKALISQKK